MDNKSMDSYVDEVIKTVNALGRAKRVRISVKVIHGLFENLSAYYLCKFGELAILNLAIKAGHRARKARGK